MSETKFVRFVETNDWEGETWTFWLQVDGNEDEINCLLWRLRDAEEQVPYDFPYCLYHGDIEPESVVDKFVEYAEQGYLDFDNKVVGKFTCPDDLGENAELLYKGGIRDFFKDPGV